MKVRFSAIDNPNDSVTEAGVDGFIMRDVNLNPSLWADAYAVSCAGGASVVYSLDAGLANAGRNFLVLGSLSGTTPGFNLPGGQHVPLNWDAFTNLVLSALGSPVFQNFMGSLNGSGEATATFDSLGPVDPVMIGQTMSFAYILGGQPKWNFSSNPVNLVFEP